MRRKKRFNCDLIKLLNFQLKNKCVNVNCLKKTNLLRISSIRCTYSIKIISYTYVFANHYNAQNLQYKCLLIISHFAFVVPDKYAWSAWKQFHIQLIFCWSILINAKTMFTLFFFIFFSLFWYFRGGKKWLWWTDVIIT